MANIMQENKSGFSLFDRKKNQFNETAGYYPAIAPLLAELGKTHDRFLFISTYDLLVLNEVTNSFDIVDIRDGGKSSFTAGFNFREELGWKSNVSRLYKNTWAINSENKGFFLVQIDTVARTVFCDAKKYFSDHQCNVIFSDKQKRLWVGTDEGLFMEYSRPQAIQSFAIESKKGDDNFSITGLYFTPDKIFAGTDNKEVIVLDKQTKQIIHRISLDTLANKDNYIQSFSLSTPIHCG
jgi:sugar lactone lactonase YvrE